MYYEQSKFAVREVRPPDPNIHVQKLLQCFHMFLNSINYQFG